MNKVVLITGSTSGIGLGIAREFATAGYAVGFHGLEPDGVEISTAAGLEFGVPTFFSNRNLLSMESIEKLVRDTEMNLGPIDVLVNNAGIQHVANIEDFPVENWNNIISVDLTAAFHTTRLVLGGMKKRNWGRIINIASVHGLLASEFKSAYVSAKHGLVGLTKVTALEGASYGITANAICPGYVDTPLVRKQIADQARLHHMTQEEVIEKVMLIKQPIKKFVKPESIGALCIFLASDHAELVTGTAIAMDGGWNAQ
ncbi:MAG: 3-hydroxybutyrate dehydrogenase [Cyclobacteriaceae bacterium]|nr:3-hydroxybutyrate dehydrogenase [Cyclobacteriaceae bacterium]MDH4295252.1 3-hydroxybutyrate dehydrogenase [Cyclobacteriaceae bacterium]MDH5251281.1 3-hydroxybutyrate dehydrogenase [Cyclobacteriaceae bacterium]